MIQLSAAAARRIALAAQGFRAREERREPGLRQVSAMVRRLGLLQLDSVNVFCRAHYMPLFSRLGPYDRRLLDRIAAHGDGPVDRRLVEYWAHEASLIPLEHHRLLRWRMESLQEAWGSMRRIAQERPQLVSDTLRLVSERGPVRARDTGISRGPVTPGEMWNWHDGKLALEYLFYIGRVGAARRVNFERHYDLIERIVPEPLRSSPPREDAQRELIRIAAAALGVASLADLRDYFRLSVADTRARVTELLEAGELLPARIAGWDTDAYLWPAARRPRAMRLRALISPFDSLVFFRPRTQRLFGFHYRIEIYVPEQRRVHGYYVLPFLLGDRLVARVDLKSDRQAGQLRVRGAFAEPGTDLQEIAVQLAEELRVTAGWLGLERGVGVERRGDLAEPLRMALAR